MSAIGDHGCQIASNKLNCHWMPSSSILKSEGSFLKMMVGGIWIIFPNSNHKLPPSLCCIVTSRGDSDLSSFVSWISVVFSSSPSPRNPPIEAGWKSRGLTFHGKRKKKQRLNCYHFLKFTRGECWMNEKGRHLTNDHQQWHQETVIWRSQWSLEGLTMMSLKDTRRNKRQPPGTMSNL